MSSGKKSRVPGTDSVSIIPFAMFLFLLDPAPCLVFSPAAVLAGFLAGFAVAGDSAVAVLDGGSDIYRLLFVIEDTPSATVIAFFFARSPLCLRNF